MQKQNNFFRAGINKDTTNEAMSNMQLRSAKNVLLLQEGEQAALTNMGGTLLKEALLINPATDLNILASVSTQNGIIYFTYDSVYGSQIKLYDLISIVEISHKLAFPPQGTIEAVYYSDSTGEYIIFTDNKNRIQRLNVTERRIERIQPMVGNPCIEFVRVESTGNLQAGSYQFMHRGWNPDTCEYSTWGTITCAIPVTLEKGGGKIGEPTNKSIVLSIPDSGYPQTQVLVIKNLDNNLVTQGTLLQPVDYTTEFTYTGDESGVVVDLSDILVDDLPIKTAKTIVSKDNRLFAGNVKLQDYRFNAQPVVGSAYTIERAVDYGNIEDATKYRSAMRGELYTYGVYYYDEQGIGVVCPLDLSPFNQNAVRIENYATGNVSIISATTTDIFTSGVFRIGDRIETSGVRANVIGINPGVIRVDEPFPFIVNGVSIDLLLGQAGNQGDSYAWKYPSRKNNQFTIFNEQGEITSLGLKIENLTNHPEWAVGFEIVVLERKKDIIYQMPHVPTIGVLGASTPGLQQNTLPYYDNNQELDLITAKIHNFGVARNIGHEFIGNDPYQFCRWYIQNGVDDYAEIPKAIWTQAPSYLYSVNGDSFAFADAQGYSIELVDAVALKQRKVFRGSSYPLIGQGFLNQFVDVFEANTRQQYFYNREGYYVKGGNNVYGQSIKEAVGGVGNLRIEYQIDLARGHGKQVLPYKPMSRYPYQHIDIYANINELALQQREHPSVSANADYLFNPIAASQRGIIMGLNAVLPDFTSIFVERRNTQGDDYFPLLNWTANTNIYDEASVGGVVVIDTSSTPHTINAGFADSVNDGDVACGAYILNIAKGLGDFRYGASAEQVDGNWCRTGICKKVDNSTDSFDLEVFGGDTFITKHSIKVRNNKPYIVQYKVIASEVDDANVGDNHTKVGVTDAGVEIIDVYLESPVNANFEKNVGQYPAEQGNDANYYTSLRDYYYHPAYSKLNCDKPLATKQGFCAETSDLSASVVWSDIKIRGGVDTALNTVDGFRRFRTNNLWNLDQKYGQVNKIVTLEGRDLHIFQENKIAFQPIGVDQLQTIDGQLIATGTGEVLGRGEYYLQRDLGSQHLRTIVQRDGMIYGLDAARKIVFRFANRGASFEFLSWNGMNEHYVSKIDANALESLYHAYIDSRYDRYVLQIGDDAHAYNTKGQYWESEMPLVDRGVAFDKRLFLNKGGFIYEAYEGSDLFGEQMVSEFSFVVNPAINAQKVFEVLEFNCQGQPLEVRCQVDNQDTGWLPFSTARHGQYNVNRLRDFANRNDLDRLRGEAMLVSVRFVEPVVFTGVRTGWRRSF